MRLFLEFVPWQGEAHRLRLEYAFRLFCAIYDHEPVLCSEQAQTADVWLSYGDPDLHSSGRKVVRLSNLYAPRSPQVPAPAPTKTRVKDENTALFYVPGKGDSPDWLAEIFEWVSCADEYSVVARDSVGRIPFRSTYLGRHGLDARRPYAAVAMRLLQWAICDLVPGGSTEPVSPSSCQHFIINTHDVDYLPLDRLGSTKRLAKNAISSLLLGKSPRLAFSQAAQAVKSAIGGEDVLDQLPALLAGELKRSVGASYFVLTSRRHRRDANYGFEHAQLSRLLDELFLNGMEVGVHGSYTSLDNAGGLFREFDRLRQLGFAAKGVRQHWLRFTLDSLVPEIERSGAAYDCSLGWSDRIGFRAGACFAFPPYDFQHERAATFIEIPLVIMDQALPGDSEESLFEAATEILSQSRRYGWGGISVLWHPTAFGGGQLSPEIGKVFWRLLHQRGAWNESWISGASFLSAIQERYSRVGLLARPQNIEINDLVH
jgi:hypothetical protein